MNDPVMQAIETVFEVMFCGTVIVVGVILLTFSVAYTLDFFFPRRSR